MSCFQRGPGANKFPDLRDVPPVNPCEGFGYKAPFRPVMHKITMHSVKCRQRKEGRFLLYSFFVFKLGRSL